MNFSHLGWQCFPQDLKTNENSKTRHEKLFLKLLVRSMQKTPKTYWYCCWLSLKVKGKSLLRKMPCNSETEHRGLWGGPDLKTSSQSTHFHDTRGHHARYLMNEATNSHTKT